MLLRERRLADSLAGAAAPGPWARRKGGTLAARSGQPALHRAAPRPRVALLARALPPGHAPRPLRARRRGARRDRPMEPRRLGRPVEAPAGAIRLRALGAR